MKAVKIFFFAAFALSFFITKAQIHNNRMQGCKNLILTQGTFPETVNRQNAIQLELGNDYSVGDWADLKAIPNIEEWIACVGLHNEQSFLVTRDGNPVYSGKRHYIAQYFAAGEAPGNFLIHDRIGNKLYLGSWFGVTTNILAIKHETHRMENENAIREHDNRIFVCKDLKLTQSTFPETVNMQNAIQLEMGNDYSVGDWADLKAIPNIEEWIACVGLHNEQSFLVTRDGNPVYSGKRHYMAQYFAAGAAPANFLIHDRIGNKLYLGSWYGVTTNILAIKHESQRVEHEIAIREHENRMICKDLKLSQSTFPETVNLQNAIQLEMGNDYSVGDWADLKAIPNIEEWIACVGLHNEQSFLVTRDGNPVYSGKRHYIAQYFAAGEAPGNFLIHDRIGNKLYLGSWYGVTTNILAVKHDTHRMEHNNAILEHDNRIPDCKGLLLTAGSFRETVNLQNTILKELGNKYSVADWADLKAIPNIDEWIACIGLQSEQSFLVTRNGNPIYKGKRHYIAQYFPSGYAPENFLVHDKIGNKLYLGSWFGITTNILAVKHDAHRMRH